VDIGFGFEGLLLLCLNWIKSIPITEVYCRDIFFRQLCEFAQAFSAAYFMPFKSTTPSRDISLAFNGVLQSPRSNESSSKYFPKKKVMGTSLLLVDDLKTEGCKITHIMVLQFFVHGWSQKC
jgi:hypothetical protein